MLRQVLMCYSDISVGYMRNGPANDGFYVQPTVQRVCRKFENIQDWAKGYQATMSCKETGYSDCH